jgi:hypothetical protein
LVKVEPQEQAQMSFKPQCRNQLGSPVATALTVALVLSLQKAAAVVVEPVALPEQAVAPAVARR